jgi:flavin reductase (DIM6/NTAB) family NADH-FMN oxidoreductase RutF
MDKETVGKALGKVVSGLYIVSVKDGDKEAGFLASWVQQAGFNPPMLSIAFNKERKAHLDIFFGSGKLVVNIMSKANGKTMSAFFKPPAEGKSIFDGLETFTDETGVPILKDSVGYLECKYASEVTSGDHVIVLVEIINGAVLNVDQEPSTHLRADGFKY